jgi:hypothetical protein
MLTLEQLIIIYKRGQLIISSLLEKGNIFKHSYTNI